MKSIQDLNFKQLLSLAIDKSHQAKKPNRTLRYLYSLAVSLDEGQENFPRTSHRMSLLEILCECASVIQSQKDKNL